MSGPQERPPPVFAIGPVVDRADIPRLCALLAALVRDTSADAVLCDVGAIIAPDAVTIEALARLRLTARRLGCDLRVLSAHPRLMDLVALTGLSDALDLGSGEVGRQAEEREQVLGVEEEVETVDTPVRDLQHDQRPRLV